MSFFGKGSNWEEKVGDAVGSALLKFGRATKKVVEACQGNASAFADDVEKKYYEIIYSLCTILDSSIDLEAAKKFVAHHNGQMCDEEKLKKILTYFDEDDLYYLDDQDDTDDRDDTDDWDDIDDRHDGWRLYSYEIDLKNGLSKKKVKSVVISEIIQLNSSLAQSVPYQCSEEEAAAICYDYAKHETKFKEQIKQKYDEILSKITPDNRHSFGKKIYDILSWAHHYSDNIRGGDSMWLNGTAAEELIHEITKSKFLEGNTIVRDILLERTVYSLWDTQSIYAVAAVVLRAVRFERSNQNEADYTGKFNLDECREFLLAEESFRNSRISIEDQISTIVRSKVFGGVSSESLDEFVMTGIFSKDTMNFKVDCWMPNATEEYYTDKLCNLFWKTLAREKGIAPNQDITTMYQTIFDTIEWSDDEWQLREVEARKNAIRRQCMECARKEHCGQLYQRENCSAFRPK